MINTAMPEDLKKQETENFSSNFSEYPEDFQASLQKFQIALENFIHLKSFDLLQRAQNQLTAFRKLLYFHKIERVEFEQQRRTAEEEIRQLRPLPTTRMRLGTPLYYISELPLIAQPLIRTMMEEERVIKLKINEMQEIIDERHERLRTKAEETGEALTDELPSWFEKACNSLKELDKEVAESFLNDGITQGEMSNTLRIIVDILMKDPASREKINDIQRDLEESRRLTINDIIAFTNRKKDRLRVNYFEAMLRVEQNLDAENSVLNGIENEYEKERLMQLRSQSSSMDKAVDRANSSYKIYLTERQSAYQDLHKTLNNLLRWIPPDHAISIQLKTLFRLENPRVINAQTDDLPPITALQTLLDSHTLFLESPRQRQELESFDNGYENSTILSKAKYEELLNPFGKEEKRNADKIKKDLFKHLRFNTSISDLIGVFLGQSDLSRLNFNDPLENAFTEALTGLESDEEFLKDSKNSEELKSSQWMEKYKGLHNLAVDRITENFKKKHHSEVLSKIKNDKKFVHYLRETQKEKLRKIARLLHSTNLSNMDIESYTKLFLKNNDALINDEVNAKIGAKAKERIDKTFANDLEQYLKKYSSRLLINQVEFDYANHQLEMLNAWKSKGKHFEETEAKWKHYQQALTQQRVNYISNFFNSNFNWLKEREQDLTLLNIDFSNEETQLMEIRQELHQIYQAYQSSKNPFELQASTIRSVEEKTLQLGLSFQRLIDQHQKEIQLRFTNCGNELNALIDSESRKIASLKIKTGQEDKLNDAIDELKKLQIDIPTKLQGLNKPSLSAISSLYTDVAEIEKKALQGKVRIGYLVIRASISRIDELTPQYKKIVLSDAANNVHIEDAKERLAELNDIRKFLKDQEKEIRAYFDKGSFEVQSSDDLITEQEKQRENADIEFHIISHGLMARRMTLKQQENEASVQNFPFVKLMTEEGRELSILNETIDQDLERTNKLHKNLLNEEGEEIVQNDAMQEANEYLQNEHQTLSLTEEKIKAFHSRETQLWQEHVSAIFNWANDVETELTTFTVDKSSIRKTVGELKEQANNINTFHFSGEHPIPLPLQIAKLFIDKQKTVQSELDEIITDEILNELGEVTKFSLRNPDSEKFSTAIATLTNMKSAYEQGLQTLARYETNDSSSIREQFRQSMNTLNQTKTEIHKLKLVTLAKKIERIELLLSQDTTRLPLEKSHVLASFQKGLHDQTTQINEYQQKNETLELNKLITKSKRSSEIENVEAEINNIEATVLQLRLEKQLMERETELDRLSYNADTRFIKAQLEEFRKAINQFQEIYTANTSSSLEDHPAFKALEEQNHQIQDGIKKLANDERENIKSSFKELEDSIEAELTQINNFIMKDDKKLDAVIQPLKEIQASSRKELGMINSTELMAIRFSPFYDNRNNLEEDFIRAKVEIHKANIEIFLNQINKIEQIGELESGHLEIAEKLEPFRALLNNQVEEIDNSQNAEADEGDDIPWEDTLIRLKEEIESEKVEVKLIDISLYAHQLLLEKQLSQSNSANFPNMQVEDIHTLSGIQNQISESLQIVKKLRTEINSEAEPDQVKELMHKAFKFIQNQFAKANAIQKEINTLQLKEQETKKRKRTEDEELDTQKPAKRQNINIDLTEVEKQIAKDLLGDNYRVTNSIPSKPSDLFPLHIDKLNGEKVLLCAIRLSSSPTAEIELKKYTAAELVMGFNWTKEMVRKKLREIGPMIEANKGALTKSLKATPRKNYQVAQSSSAQQQAIPSGQSSPKR